MVLPHPVPEVGDTVCLNDHGIQLIWNAPGLAHMKTLKMQVIGVGQQPTDQGPYTIWVRNADLSQFTLNHMMFDIVAKQPDNLIHKAYLEYVAICSKIGRTPHDEKVWTTMTDVSRTLLIQQVLADANDSKREVMSVVATANQGGW